MARKIDPPSDARRTNKLSEELRRIREIRGISLRAIESTTKISNAYLSQLETGKAENPSPSVLFKLAKVLDVPYKSLMDAAGYLGSEWSEDSPGKRVTGVRAALLSAKLTEEEEQQVVDFVGFLRTKRRLKKNQR